VQKQAFEVSISRTYSIGLGEFGGKGDRKENVFDGHSLS